MDLYIQLGWGMMELSRSLTREWGATVTILSPRDLGREQLRRLSSDLRELGGSVLLDPQFYLPRSDHHRLISHCYWPHEYDTADFASGGCLEMVQLLAELNGQLGTSQMIVPGRRAETVDALWLDSQEQFLRAAGGSTDQLLIVTICLSAKALCSLDQISRVVDQAERMPAPGYYIVAESPAGSYFVDDPVWLANLLDLSVGLRRLGAKVVVGYSSQQQLLMACTKATAIAAGKWANVRSFSAGRFRARDSSDVKRRATWYYNPLTFSEYTLPYLDMAYRAGLKGKMLSTDTIPAVISVLDVSEPSASGWNEAMSAAHFLTSIRNQAHALTRSTFDETVQAYRVELDRASDALNELHSLGIYGRDRDFKEAVPANRSALAYLERVHGPVLRRIWTELD